MRSLRTGLIILAAVLAAASVCAQEGIDGRIKDKETELERLRREIAEQRRRIAEIEAQEKDVSGYIQRLEREEELTRKLLDGLEEKEGMLEQQAVRLRADLEASESEYTARLEVFSARLRELYKDGPRHAVRELLAADDFPDLLQRYKFISMIAERDAELVASLREKKASIETQEAEITEVLHEVSAARSEKEYELARLRENEAKRRGTLAGLQKRRKEFASKAKELEEAEKRLQELIERMERSRTEGTADYGESDFASLKGRLPRPAAGEVTRGFGRFRHPEFGTVTFNTGIDIGTRRGEPVRAVARGRVEFAGDLPGYGNCIILNHGGGYYTLYAHASQIFVQQGQGVDRGTLIAEAGGDPSGSGGTLHFEIRQSKKALDPSGWIAR